MKPNLLCLAVGATVVLTVVSCKKATEASSSPDASSPANASAAAGKADDAVTLQLRWPVGGRFAHRMQVASTMQLPAMPGMPAGRPMTQDADIGQDYSLTVLAERPGGGREVELEFQAVNMSVRMAGNEVLGFDTRGEATGDDENPSLRPFRQIIGQKVKFLLDASNKVERVEGAKELTKKVFGDTEANPNPMASMFSEDSFKQLVSQGRNFPTQPVKPGATWPSKFDVVMGPLGKVPMDLTYTFKGWEQREQRRCAALEFTGSIGASTGDPSNPMGAMLAASGGQCSGTSWFDPARGMVIDSLVDQTIQLRMKLPAPPGPGNRTTPPAETILKQNVSVKLVEESKK